MAHPLWIAALVAAVWTGAAGVLALVVGGAVRLAEQRTLAGAAAR